MNFSSILDISSFFIGIIINLLFVALMCYYFKSKYDNLELAQNEQAKILYDLLRKERQNCMMTGGMCPVNISCSLPLKDNHKPIEIVPIEDDSSDSEYSSESSSDSEDEVNETKHLSIQEQTVPPEEISFIVTKVEEKKDHDEYGKMTMKQLKELLSSKGIKAKPNMRKEELIELAIRKESNLEVSGSPSLSPFSSENIEIEGMEEIST
jgi:hypothetical protein